MKFPFFSILKINFYEFCISNQLSKKVTLDNWCISLTEIMKIVNLSWGESQVFAERFYGFFRKSWEKVYGKTLSNIILYYLA